MDTGLVMMNPKELTRAALMQRISERRTTQAEVAQELRLSLRQVERLYAAYKRVGAKALASKPRGRASNRRLSEAHQQSVFQAVRKDFADFGPCAAYAISRSSETSEKYGRRS
jgi:transposase